MKVVDAAAWAVPWFFVVSVTVMLAPGAADDGEVLTLEMTWSGAAFGSSCTLMFTELVAWAP